MAKNVSKKKKRVLICLISLAALLMIVTTAFLIYASDYYKADTEAIEAFKTDENIAAQVLDNGNIVYKPDGAKTGFVFYPGGKVEHTAYRPLMAECADRGIMCVIVKMPFNLAVFDSNAADGVIAQYPEIEHWYIGGHSLGGAMAAAYVAKHTDKYDGLILLGSYSDSNLSKTSLNVLSVYGSEDKVLNREKYEQNRANLPSKFTEVIIDGGCHSYFGMYGAQKGDGTPTITNEEQISQTVDAITELMSFTFSGDTEIENSYGIYDGNTTSSEQIDLTESYPQYFGLDASNGLDVIVWQMAENHYSFGLLEHSDTERDLLSTELFELKGIDTEQMKAVLSTYNIDDNDIFIIPWQNPISSYIPDCLMNNGDEDMNAKTEAYIAGIRKMLFE